MPDSGSMAQNLNGEVSGVRCQEVGNDREESWSMNHHFDLPVRQFIVCSWRNSIKS